MTTLALGFSSMEEYHEVENSRSLARVVALHLEAYADVIGKAVVATEFITTDVPSEVAEDVWGDGNSVHIRLFYGYFTLVTRRPSGIAIVE